MPRASWKGFLRLSLVSCPVYLTPATTKTKSIRLHQVWVPRPEPASRHVDVPDEDDEPPVWNTKRVAEPSAPADQEPEEVEPATRIALQPVARDTREAIERDE